MRPAAAPTDSRKVVMLKVMLQEFGFRISRRGL
jgi:hypothetical protein